MRVIRECVIIFGITLAGELLNLALPFPVPAGVYGLFLLLALLLSGALKLEQVEETGNFLLEIMPILFVPAAVGLTESYEAVKEILFPLLITCLMSTVIVMAVRDVLLQSCPARSRKMSSKPWRIFPKRNARQ